MTDVELVHALLVSEFLYTAGMVSLPFTSYATARQLHAVGAPNILVVLPISCPPAKLSRVNSAIGISISLCLCVKSS